GEREAEAAASIGEPEQAVFAPAVGPPGRLFMGERPPGMTSGGIVLTDRPPLPLGQIGPPALPVLTCNPLGFRRESIPFNLSARHVWGTISIVTHPAEDSPRGHGRPPRRIIPDDGIPVSGDRCKCASL